MEREGAGIERACGMEGMGVGIDMENFGTVCSYLVNYASYNL